MSGAARADRDSALLALRDRGWRLEGALPGNGELPLPLASAPGALTEWVGAFSRLTSADGAVWFLSADDYRGTGTGVGVGTDTDAEAFAWDAFAEMSREAATTGEQLTEVELFWQRHWPILLSVRDHYCYLAIRDDGAIVFGEEPEFEEVEVVAGSLAELLEVAATDGTSWQFG